MNANSGLRTVFIRAVSRSSPNNRVARHLLTSCSILPRASLREASTKTKGPRKQDGFNPEKSSLSKEAQDRANLLAEISKPRSRQNQIDRSKAHELMDMLEVVAEENDNHGSGIAARQGSLSKSLGVDPALSSPFSFPHIRSSLPALDAPLRLDAFVGRSEPVQGPGGLATALRKLELKCALNKVKSEAARQRFHERPGLKRKRLRSERWRARFKQGFAATVLKVQRLKKQGW